MDRNRSLTGGLLVLAAVIAAITFLPSGKGMIGVAEPGPARVAQSNAVTSAPARPREPVPGSTRRAARPAGAVSSPRLQAEGPQPAVGATAAAGLSRPSPVALWETLVDRLVEPQDVPALELAPRVKEAFDRLDRGDQMDGVRRALNLLPDEQFPALYAILLDRAVPREVLDAILSDALNRPEELKYPLLRELSKDREHPLFLESVRILDAVGAEAD